MPLTTEIAKKIAAEKSIALIGEGKLEKYCAWWGVENGTFHLGLGLSAEKRETDFSKSPVIDERIPWEKVLDIYVDLATGEVSTQERSIVTIFD